MSLNAPGGVWQGYTQAELYAGSRKVTMYTPKGKPYIADQAIPNSVYDSLAAYNASLAAKANAEAEAKEDAAAQIEKAESASNELIADRDAAVEKGGAVPKPPGSDPGLGDVPNFGLVEMPQLYAGKTGEEWQQLYADATAAQTQLTADFDAYKTQQAKDFEERALQTTTALQTLEDQFNQYKEAQKQETEKAQLTSANRIKELEAQLLSGDELFKQTNQEYKDLIASKDADWQQKFDELTKLSGDQQRNFELKMSDANAAYADQIKQQQASFDDKFTTAQADWKDQLQTQLADQQTNFNTMFNTYRDNADQMLADERAANRVSLENMADKLGSMKIQAQTPTGALEAPTPDADGIKLKDKSRKDMRSVGSLRNKLDPKVLLNLSQGI